jgi:glycosyltransferase involved in cell wall biosynthesis
MRTLPVVLKGSIKERIDNYLSWEFLIKVFGGIPDSYSLITEYMKDEMKRLYGFSPKTYCYWSSAVSLENFNLSGMQKTNKEVITFFYHGTITETRGIGLLYDAFKILLGKSNKNNIRLLIVGEGSYLNELRERTKNDGLLDKVVITGYVQYNEILNYIVQADICVCPLPNRVEWNVSSPIKIFEYMAVGKPIVCTDIPAHRNVLDGQPFAIFTGDTTESIAEGMSRAVDSLDELLSYEQQEKEFVEKNYTWEKQAKVLYSYLKETYNIK